MRTQIQELIENKSVLENSYILPADGAWNDDVKFRFFSEHIPPIREEHNAFLSAMQETAQAFESGKSRINSLM